MKIRKLSIKNYKVFNDLELDFTDANGKTLDKIVLAGVNGCGKTTILELVLSIFNDRIARNIPIYKNRYIEVAIELNLEEKKQVQKHIDVYLKSLYENSWQIEKYKDEEKSIQQKLIDLYNDLGKDNEYFTLKYEDTPGTIFYTSIVSMLIFEKLNNRLLVYLPVKQITQKDNQAIKIIHLDADKAKMKQLALKDIRDEVFKNEDIAPRQSKQKAIKRITKALQGLTLTTKLVDLSSDELIFESANGERIKFEELSNGEQTLYFRAIYLSTLNPQNSIIMIDEPEESLHPTWQQKVMQLYQNIGENNQVIVATHSPHIIGAANAEEVFLLEIDNKEVEALHPRYTKGHSIDYILEVMGANPRDTEVINKVDAYLALIRKGKHETAEGLKLKAEIDALHLDPNGDEIGRLDLSLRRFKAVGV